MVIERADVRMRTFNFFIVLTGALVAGYLKQSSNEWLIIFPAAGILSTVLFYCLELRGRDFHRHWGGQLDVVEERLWALAGLQWKSGTLPDRRISHRRIYRTLFAIVAVAWSVALFWGLYYVSA